MRPATVIFLFTVFAAAGYCLAVRSWGGAVSVYLGDERGPAAERRPGDFSEIKRGTVNMGAHKQLLAEAEIEKRDGFIGIHLGNPLMRIEDSGSGFACRVQRREGFYDRIQMTFTGVGIAGSGEVPEMVIETPCEAGRDPSLLTTIWVPMQDILALPPKDQEAVFETVKVKLSYIPGEWPESWALSRVRIFSEKSVVPPLVIEGSKMREARETLLSFEWR